MAKDEKIRKVMEKYRKYFENSYKDIARTEKGEWLFLAFDFSLDDQNRLYFKLSFVMIIFKIVKLFRFIFPRGYIKSIYFYARFLGFLL